MPLTEHLHSILTNKTLKNSYKIISASDGQFRVQLSEGSTWLPEFYALTKRVPLTVTSIDTGAGPYALPDGGVVVAYIVADREGVVCDDSCEYSFDGVCDESNGGDGDWYSYYDHGDWDDDYYAEYAYYYDYGDIDDFAGQNVDDDYLATAYSYLNGGSYGNWAYSDDFAIGACLQVGMYRLRLATQ
jgi:hypothetical protein